jgi:hypothetical protein
MKYGYARVSTDDQNPALQLAALQKAGCKTVFKDDGLSGATTKRPALLRCLKKLENGDTLIVWKLDRLCIVKITYRKNGRSVFCEALQIERNFEKRYDRDKTTDKYKITEHKKDDSSASPMVMSHWYRAKLSPNEPLKTQCEYCLEIKAFHFLHNRWWGMLKTCTDHRT